MLEGDVAADYVGILMRGVPVDAAKLRRDALRARSSVIRGRLRFARVAALRIRPRARAPRTAVAERGTQRGPRRPRTRRARPLAPGRPARGLDDVSRAGAAEEVC